MIINTLTFAMHVLIHSIGPARRLFGYLVPQIRREMISQANHGKNINSKHLKKGDPLPPYKNVLRVYNMRYCPYAQRAILALNAKHLDYDVVNCNLVSKPDWLFVKSELGKVPALEIEDGVTIHDSLTVVEYLDDAYPKTRLTSTDPVRRAQDKNIIVAIEPIQAALFVKLKLPEKFADDHKESFKKGVSKIQSELEKRGTKYLHGDVPGYVDYMIWPWFERLPALAKFFDPSFELDKTQFARLWTYIEAMKQDQAVKDYLIDDETYKKFMESYATGETRYDFLDDVEDSKL